MSWGPMGTGDPSSLFESYLLWRMTEALKLYFYLLCGLLAPSGDIQTTSLQSCVFNASNAPLKILLLEDPASPTSGPLYRNYLDFCVTEKNYTDSVKIWEIQKHTKKNSDVFCDSGIICDKSGISPFNPDLQCTKKVERDKAP